MTNPSKLKYRDQLPLPLLSFFTALLLSSAIVSSTSAQQPDGKIVFSSDRDGISDGSGWTSNIFKANINGSGYIRLTTGGNYHPSWQPHPAATVTVTNTNDSGAGSLRQAIADAAPGDTINFSGSISGGTITLTSGQLVINKNLTIQGPGAGLLSISGNYASRVFRINAGVTAAIDGLRIKDGALGLPPSVGGGILNQGVLSVSNSTITGNIGEAYAIYTDGAGIFNDTSGTLNLSKSIVSGNLSNDPDGNSTGGGIHNRGVMTITDSTVSDNVSNSGGGISNYGTMTVANSTISRNTIINGGGGGGGIFNWDPFQRGVTLTISNSTISDNSGGGYTAGGIVSALDVCCPAANESLRNTIVAGNTSGDIEGIIETASHNLIGDAASSGGIQNGVNGNIVGVNPLLGPLANNGGPTMTHALLLGSPAINGGNNCVLTANGCGNGNAALTADQRGMPRNGAVDIGAFERQAKEVSSATPFDYDGDGKSDVSVFRPSTGLWYLLRSTAGYTGMQWGEGTDKITPADFDGDGKTDVAVFRASNSTWYIFNSATQTFSTENWGQTGDLAVPADYDGDGKADVSVYRPSDANWYRKLSGGGFSFVNFGTAEDKPVPSDWDGDGKADIGVFRPSSGIWYFLRTTAGFTGIQWGVGTDIQAPGDYDGDGKTDVAVFRPENGTWYLGMSTLGFASVAWGQSGDIPSAGDFDGDGKTDVAVFRPSNGHWYILNSTAGIADYHFGESGDQPTESAFRY